MAALVAGSAVLFAASPVLAAAVLVGFPSYWSRPGCLPGPLVGRAEREQSTLAAATAAATDLITGLRVIKGIGAEPARPRRVRAGQPDRAAGPAGRRHGSRAAT